MMTIRTKTEHSWARLLAYITGLVNHELLLHNEYFATENRNLRALARAPPIAKSAITDVALAS